MYLPAHFQQADPAQMHALMRAHPLAWIVTQAAGGMAADPIPLELDAEAGPHGTLRGHVARANPLWRADGTPVLALFQGPQAYVSPGWYPSKALTHKAVPTWNYAVVEARGTLRAVEDAPWLRALVARLTDHHEATQPHPWSLSDAPGPYIDQMLRAIVGIEIPVERLSGKWKLSQNRSLEDRLGVAGGLEADGRPTARETAAMVRAAGEP